MSLILKPKRGSTAPTTSNLADGEMAIDTANKVIYQRVGGSIIAVANYSDGAGGAPVKFPSTTSLTGAGTPGGTSLVPQFVAPDSAGALTANVWKEVLSLSTPGILLGVAVRQGSTAAQAVGVRVYVDDVLVGTAEMSSAGSNSSSGAWLGMNIPGSGAVAFGWAPFQRLRVEVRSSTSNISVGYGVHYTGLSA